MRILLTGGCGFIGSHTALALLAAGHEPVLLDNFINSDPSVVDRLAAAAGRPLTLVEGDVGHVPLVRSTLADQRIEAVLHFASLKAVAKSVANPLAYHQSCVGGLLALLEAMDAEEVRTLVFSSSATVYGEPRRLPIDENHTTGPLNPYGQAKLICETILSDLATTNSPWRISILRYFNPVGAHPSGLIGEDPKGVPNNLMPLIVRAAAGKMEVLPIFGTDYATPDGTAVRDYIHVVDLAEGHVAALGALANGERYGLYNLGTGRGTTVSNLIAAFENATGTKIPRMAADRRPGDVAEVYAAADKAGRELGWSAKRGLMEMCADSWRFAMRNQ